ncbi:hypothetical protein MSP8887_02706 [Marinomonas spartinae]|uniref:Uncharacterized protein n=1 Tax=Marinomonas spartinae TaxID=1792290 RepID=A0A1A8TEN0_9GAMM|nr:hypothetical protein [Marinomonas spartinae]SBS30293.1 hypothetical protein MSP8886_01761 [Marinomonas spartinae]SBS36775.1 hypothetical protein MSP8887_02706 [Marinomonas spartinae]
MFEFIMFVAACAAIAFFAVTIQRQVSQPKKTMQPIKIETEKKSPKRMPHRRYY